MNVARNFIIQKVFLWYSLFFIFMQNKGKNEIQVKLITGILIEKNCGKSYKHIIMHNKNVLPFDVFELLRIRSNSHYVLLLFNWASSGFPNAAVIMPHGMCQVHAVVLIALVSSCRWSYETRLPRRCSCREVTFSRCKF